MKKLFGLSLFVLVMLSFSEIVFAQNQSPIVYLNQKQIDVNKVFLNPDRIDSMNIQKNTPNGELYFFTKKKEFTFLRLTDIVKKFTSIKSDDKPILYRINGKIINDTTSVQIDDTYNIYVEIEKTSEVKYLSSSFANLTILNIDLEKEKRKPNIMIRG